MGAVVFCMGHFSPQLLLDLEIKWHTVLGIFATVE
jgi:hypothetical protein